jgi:hypothetical protein
VRTYLKVEHFNELANVSGIHWDSGCFAEDAQFVRNIRSDSRCSRGIQRAGRLVVDKVSQRNVSQRDQDSCFMASGWQLLEPPSRAGRDPTGVT